MSQTELVDWRSAGILLDGAEARLSSDREAGAGDDAGQGRCTP